jgi:hypothetical protein
MQHLEGNVRPVLYVGRTVLNPLNAELNSICHLLETLGTRHILHISWIGVNRILPSTTAIYIVTQHIK